MKRLKRNEEGVSPVIATILMVAITVVLAATLWMMLDTGDEGDMPLSATISGDYDGENLTIEFVSLGTPSTAPLDDVEIVFDGGEHDGTHWGDEIDEEGGEWNLLNEDDEVRSSSYLEIDDNEGPDSVTIFIDGYDGSRTVSDF